jgi:hypothetical protein
VKIKHGLAVGFVLGMKQRQRLGFILGAQAVMPQFSESIVVCPVTFFHR